MNKIKTILFEFSRILISFVFIFSSVIKANDPVGLNLKIKEYLSFIPISFHSVIDYSAPIISIVLILLEFLVGIGLFLSLRSKKLVFTTTMLMTFMTLVTFVVYISSYVKDCGCFGDAIHLTNGETLLKNIILIPFVVFLHINKNLFSPIWKSVRILKFNYLLSILGFLLFLGFNYYKLPFIDFREYKIGTNLRKQIELQDKNINEYFLKNTKYVYEKDNKKYMFTSDSLPSGDGWKFVEVKEPQYNSILKYDFHPIDTENKEDISKRILNDPKPTVIVITKSLDNIDSKSDLIITTISNKLYEKGYSQYLIYSGEHSQNNNFLEIYSNSLGCVATMDKTTINTIVRSTPAMLVMRNGVILDKISRFDFPNINNIVKFVGRLDSMNPNINKRNYFRIYTLLIALLLGFVGNIKSIFRLILIKNNLNNEKEHSSRELEDE